MNSGAALIRGVGVVVFGQSSKTGVRLVSVDEAGDVLPAYRGNPVGQLLAYHNLCVEDEEHKVAELLIGTCMDPRLELRIPKNFAYVLRSAGANMSSFDFDISFAVAVAGVKAICVIGHTDCRMASVGETREAFVNGLVDRSGWSRVDAEERFDSLHSGYGLGDAGESAWQQAGRLRREYGDIVVAPLVYSVEDHRLWQVVG